MIGQSVELSGQATGKEGMLGAQLFLTGLIILKAASMAERSS